MTFTTMMDYNDIERSAATPETCSSMGQGSQIRVQILEAQVADLRKQLKLAQCEEADQLGEELEQKFIEVTKRNEELERVVAEERDKLVQAAQLAMSASTKRLENEELRLELDKQLHNERKELEEARVLIASLNEQLAEKDQDLRECQENLQQTEEAFKSKQRYEDTWKEIHESNRMKISALETELHVVRKENLALPIIQQQLTHSGRKATQSSDEAHRAMKERNFAVAKVDGLERKIEKLEDAKDELEEQIAAHDNIQLAFSAERKAREICELRVAEVEGLLAKSRSEVDALKDERNHEELICEVGKAKLDAVLGELRSTKGQHQEAVAELNRIQEGRMLLDFHEKMQNEELESQAEEVAKLRVQNNSLCTTKQQLGQAKAQVRGALMDGAEKNALLFVARKSATEARLMASESQAAQQDALECREKMERQLAEMQQENRAFREQHADVESSKGKVQEFEAVIAALRRELQETKTRHATDLRARTRAEQLLSEHEAQCQTRMVSRGCSPVRDEVVLQLQDEMREMKARNAGLETSKAVAEGNLLKQQTHNETLIANMHKKVAAIAATHDDLRDMYTEHLGLIKARDPYVASYLPVFGKLGSSH